MEHVTEATENYLETLLILSQRLEEVHAIDICTELGYSRPTVSVFLKGMREKGLVDIDCNNHIWLTEAGRAIAEPIYERHNILLRMLELMGVEPKTAAIDACKMEHDLSEETYSCIRKFVDRMKHSE